MMTRLSVILVCVLAASAQAEVKVYEGTSKLISTTVDALPALDQPLPDLSATSETTQDGKPRPVAIAIGETKEVGTELVILGAPAEALWSGFKRGNPQVKIETRTGVTYGSDKLIAVFHQINLPGITCTRPESDALGQFITTSTKDPVLKDFGQTRCVVRVAVKGVVTGATAVRDN